MSEKGIKAMLSKGKPLRLKSIDVDLCEDLVYGKQRKVSFSKVKKSPKAERLELVHTDYGVKPLFLLLVAHYVL